jgi:hypothetical protein
MSDTEEATIYDLLPVILGGDKVYARPVHFECGEDDMPLKVLSYQSTCPKCSQLVEFNCSQIKQDKDNTRYVQGCDDCPIPKKLKAYHPDVENPATMSIDSVEVENIGEENMIEGADFESYLSDVTIFQDPIESGKLVVPTATKVNV